MITEKDDLGVVGVVVEDWDIERAFKPKTITTDYSVEFSGDVIVFHNLKAGSNISIFAANGILMMNKTLANDGDYTYNLSNLSQGVYVVNVNGKTYKIVKK